MSKLEQLIKELCSNGVEYVPLLGVASVLYGYPCNASLFNTDRIGKPLIRIRDVLNGTTATFTTEEVPSNYFISRGDLLIGMDGNFHVSKWKDEEGILCQRVCKLYSANKTILLDDFLFYLIGPIIKSIEESKKSGTVKHLLDRDIKSIKIPLPPLPLQEEIVRILDDLTEYTAELTSELTSELEARKKQYAYYRDRLLAFDAEGVNKVEWRALGEVCSLKAGKSIPSDKISSVQTPEYCIPCFGGNGLRGYVQEANQQGDNCLIGRQGALCGNVCYATGRYYATEHAVVVSDSGNFNSRYLYHMLVHKNLNQYKTAGAQPGLFVGKIETIIVPVPEMKLQNRIANVLDNFDAICSDLNIGLPAEIEARRKQYEYYRDKLLNFKRFAP